MSLYLLLDRKEKERLVIKLIKEGKTTRVIAREIRISLQVIGKIIRKYTGGINEEQFEARKLTLESTIILSQESAPFEFMIDEMI
ncbi:helix-turn-helix domain-containing protein [Candidatus Nitrosocosmicus sp. R]